MGRHPKIFDPLFRAMVRAVQDNPAAKGARVLTGGGMCVHQAVDAFRLFTGITPDAARMHRSFAAALLARDKAMGAR